MIWFGTAYVSVQWPSIWSDPELWDRRILAGRGEIFMVKEVCAMKFSDDKRRWG
jgi:hypothetical protein